MSTKNDPFISVSSGAFNGYPLEVAFEQVAQIGGTHLELIFIDGYSNPFEESYFCDESAGRVRELYAEHGLQPGAFAAHLDLSPDKARDHFTARMDFAKAIGSEFMITYAAPMHCEKAFYSNMEGFVRHAEDIGIVIAFENPGDGKRNLIDGGRSGAEVVRRFGSDAVKFNYDFGNLMSHFREDVLPEEDILHVLDETVHLHVKDTHRVADGWEFPAIGDGDIDFTTIFQTVAPKCMGLPLCLEVPLTMTRDVYGAAQMATSSPTLETIRTELGRSLRFMRALTRRS